MNVAINAGSLKGPNPLQRLLNWCGRQIMKALRWARLEESIQGVDGTMHQALTLAFVMAFPWAAYAVGKIQYETYDLWLGGAGIVGVAALLLQMALVEQAAERLMAKDEARRKEARIWTIGAVLCAAASIFVMVTAQGRADERRVAIAQQQIEDRKTLKDEIDDLKMRPEMWAPATVEAAKSAYADMLTDQLPDGRRIGEACVTPTRAILQDCARLTSARAQIADARKRQDTEAEIAKKEAKRNAIPIPDTSDLDIKQVQGKRVAMSIFIEILMGIAVAFIGWRRGLITDEQAAARAVRAAAGASSMLDASAARAEAAAARLEAAKAPPPPVDPGIQVGQWMDMGNDTYRTPAGVTMTLQQVKDSGLLDQLLACNKQGRLVRGY